MVNMSSYLNSEIYPVTYTSATLGRRCHDPPTVYAHSDPLRIWKRITIMICLLQLLLFTIVHKIFVRPYGNHSQFCVFRRLDILCALSSPFCLECFQISFLICSYHHLNIFSLFFKVFLLGIILPHSYATFPLPVPHNFFFPHV